MRAPRTPDDPYVDTGRQWKCLSCGKVPADGTINETIKDGKVILRWRLCRDCEEADAYDAHRMGKCEGYGDCRWCASLPDTEKEW
jgi:hypothetical protein